MASFLKQYSHLLLLAYAIFVSVYALMLRTSVRLNGSRMYWASQGLSFYCILGCLGIILIIWCLASTNKKITYNGVMGLALLSFGLLLKSYLNWHFSEVGRWLSLPMDISTAVVIIGATLLIVNSLIQTISLYSKNIHFATGVMFLAVAAGIVFHFVWVPGYFDDEVGNFGGAILIVLPILPLLFFSSILYKMDRMSVENSSPRNYRLLYSRDFILVSAILIITTICAFVLNVYYFREARLSTVIFSPAIGIVSALISILILLLVANRWNNNTGGLVLIGCGLFLLSTILLFFGGKAYAVSFIIEGAAVVLILEQCVSFILKHFEEPGAYGLWLLAIVITPLTKLLWHKMNSLVLAFGNVASVFFLFSLLMVILAYLFHLSLRTESRLYL